MAQRPTLFGMLHAAHAVEAEVELKLNGMGLSTAKLAALKALWEAGESLPLSQLAGQLSCVKSNITQLVDRLEADGLVIRKPDRKDRRTKLAALTAAGRKAAQAGMRVMAATERDVLNRLTRDEAHQLHALLGKMRNLT
jgi:MarR family transcriptional regulator, transcriptional regulator for hemolysin